MHEQYTAFGAKVARTLLSGPSPLLADPAGPTRIEAVDDSNNVARLDLTPFHAVPASETAAPFFETVATYSQLLSAYQRARQSLPFEESDNQAIAAVDEYASKFMAKIFDDAKSFIDDARAKLIARWVSDLDVYCAVRAVESLLNSKADLALLEVGRSKGWSIHFDHLAIRCGTKARGDAERVRDLLVNRHGYTASQVKAESYYQFPDGWNAYPVYKILRNGQVLRVFIDQSDAEDKLQIIQHWNRVYGYTAHHLAMRATRLVDGVRQAVPLDDVMAALRAHGIGVMAPTGGYTDGLLLQVFTKPESNPQVPGAIKQDLARLSANLEKTIENGKLLELVSRRELPPALCAEYFALYGLKYDPANPLHSAPIYQYFLPAQAAHVIRTSQQVDSVTV